SRNGRGAGLTLRHGTGPASLSARGSRLDAPDPALAVIRTATRGVQGSDLLTGLVFDGWAPPPRMHRASGQSYRRRPFHRLSSVIRLTATSASHQKNER